MTREILPISGVPDEVKAQYDRLTSELATVLNTMETVRELHETMKACVRDNRRYQDFLQQEHDRIISEIRKIWSGPIFTYEKDLIDE